MKAARIHAYGHSDQIHVEDISEPELGPRDILIRVRAAGINPIDWKIREGYLASVAPRPLPFTLGQDFCGEVIALGRDAPDVAVECGTSVYGFANGAYAEYVVVPPENFASKPEVVDDATAAGLPTPGLTALQIVERHAQPARGQSVLIHGAAGAVGSIATQLCLARGARVIATASSKDVDYLIGLGVTRVIDYHTQRFEHIVREVDVVIDLVGAETFARSVGVVRAGGVMVSAVGPVDAAKNRNVRAERITMRKNRDDLVTLAALVDRGVIRPRPARVVPLAEAGEAQDLVEHGHPSAKLVLAVM